MKTYLTETTVNEKPTDYFLNKECKGIIDNRIKTIKSPTSFSKPFREIELIDFYKSKELENFLFFTSFIVLNDLFDKNIYFDHLMLLNSALYKLYSKSASDDDIQKAKYEIDLFINILNTSKFKFSDAFFKYNTHTLPHLVEDRLRFNMPLSRYNEYGYESELHIYKSLANSNNKSVESIVNRIAIRSMYQINVKDVIEEVLGKDEMWVYPNTFLVKKIREIKSLEENTSLTFYKKAKLYNKTIRIKDSIKYEDSFVKIEDLYYQILLIFNLQNNNYVLVENVPIEKEEEIHIKSFNFNYKFKLNQYKIIDETKYKNHKEYNVFRLDKIDSHVIYYNEKQVIDKSYIIDFDI